MKTKVFGLVLLILIFVGDWMWKDYQSALHQPVLVDRTVLLEIEKGDSLDRIGDKLVAEKLVLKPFWFKVIVLQKNALKKLKTGEYELRPGLTAPKIIALFVQGKTKQHSITFPEGWSFKEVLREIEKNTNLEHTLNGVAFENVMSKLNLAMASAASITIKDGGLVTIGGQALVQHIEQFPREPIIQKPALGTLYCGYNSAPHLYRLMPHDLISVEGVNATRLPGAVAAIAMEGVNAAGLPGAVAATQSPFIVLNSEAMQSSVWPPPYKLRSLNGGNSENSLGTDAAIAMESVNAASQSGAVSAIAMEGVNAERLPGAVSAIAMDGVNAERLPGAVSALKSPEGLFFPDTYFFEKHTADVVLLKRAYEKMQRVLQQEWLKKADGLPFKTPYEALILASIVEKETGTAAERPQIAGVFVRRLEQKMLLQTDPTVIYGMGESYQGDIKSKDLTTATPYNTYVISGLPPTPIAMPGRAALHAVMHPDQGDTVYFVARGDGTHVFSTTLKDHNLAVDKFQRNKK